MSLRDERQTVRRMIGLFCRLRHTSDQLCKQCSELLEYADKRLAKCPFGNAKPTCQRCQIHCYAPEMRRRITEVMRFSGPRMIFHHPITAMCHLLHAKRPNKLPADDI